MQQKLLFCIFLILGLRLQAQLTITPGAQFYMAGPADVTLHNTSLVNNGTFDAGQGTVSFTGNGHTSIMGTQPLNFYRITVNKTPGNAITLHREIGVCDRLLFTEGLLDLGDFNVNLGNSGWLSGESETSRITTPGTGKVLITSVVNASSGINPGNLGAVFSTDQSLGIVSIARGHQVQVSDNGTPVTVRRYYNIGSSMGSSFSGTLRLHYLDAELNGADELNMSLYTVLNDGSWQRHTPTNSSLKLNYLEISGTISGKLWAMANNNPGNNASARPNGPDAQKEVRLTQPGWHPNAEISSPVAASAFRLWPNPTTGNSFLSLYSAAKTSVAISIMDSKGALVKTQREWLLPGANRVPVNVGQLPPGTYTVQALWNDGRDKKAAQLVKQ